MSHYRTQKGLPAFKGELGEPDPSVLSHHVAELEGNGTGFSHLTLSLWEHALEGSIGEGRSWGACTRLWDRAGTVLRGPVCIQRTH